MLTSGITQQRQTVISQFYQNDRLVVEGGLSVGLHAVVPELGGSASQGRAADGLLCRARIRMGKEVLYGKRILGELHTIILGLLVELLLTLGSWD